MMIIMDSWYLRQWVRSCVSCLVWLQGPIGLVLETFLAGLSTLCGDNRHGPSYLLVIFISSYSIIIISSYLELSLVVASYR